VSVARFDAALGEVVLTLDSGATVAVPAALLPALAGAPDGGRTAVRVAQDGALLQWPELRLEVPVRGLLLAALDLQA
jgi:hypothetical protein